MSVDYALVREATEECPVARRDEYRLLFALPWPLATASRTHALLELEDGLWGHVAERADWGCYPCPP